MNDGRWSRALIKMISLAQVKHPHGISLEQGVYMHLHTQTQKAHTCAILAHVHPVSGSQGKLSLSDDNVTASSLFLLSFGFFMLPGCWHYLLAAEQPSCSHRTEIHFFSVWRTETLHSIESIVWADASSKTSLVYGCVSVTASCFSVCVVNEALAVLKINATYMTCVTWQQSTIPFLGSCCEYFYQKRNISQEHIGVIDSRYNHRVRAGHKTSG